MPLTIVNSVTVRGDRLGDFEEGIAELARRASEKDEKWRWTGHQAQFGNVLTYHFAYEATDFAGLEKLGSVEELWRRVLGQKRGEEAFRKVNGCVQEVRHTVSLERPDLSYAQDPVDASQYPLASVTSLRAKPGRIEACEELIRKLAEAIPKADVPMRLVAYQTMVGDLRQYFTVRPLRRLADLDDQLPGPDLLSKAFGASEGGLIWRTGTDAVEEAEREILVHREDLSNPPRS